MALIDDLKARFSNLDDTSVDTFLPLYENNYKCYYNVEYGSNDCDDEIILNMLAHLVQVNVDQSDSEAIKQVGSESVGSVSTSYVVAPLDNSDKFWTSTFYGQTYKMLLSKNAGAYFV